MDTDTVDSKVLENIDPPCISDSEDENHEQQISIEKSKDAKIEDIDDKQDDAVKTKNNSNNFDVADMPEDYKDTYEAYLKEVLALSTIPITMSVTPEFIKNFKHFNLRYYEDKYCIDFKTPEPTGYNDVLIRIHSNKLFLISLASGNDIIRCDKNITGINFLINSSDRSEVKLEGKRKKGAKVIEPQTILCQVKCEGVNKLFNIRAGIPGRILEINDSVKKDPNLLKTDPKGYGFLAVVAPKGHPSIYEKVLADLKLLSEEAYIKHLKERPPKLLTGGEHSEQRR